MKLRKPAMIRCADVFYFISENNWTRNSEHATQFETVDALNKAINWLVTACAERPSHIEIIF